MAISIQKGRSVGVLSMTPLIDVVFLLLIFFLVASRFEQEERDMEVNLPRASQATPTIFPGKEIFVNLTPAGDYFVDGQRLDVRGLCAKLKAANDANPGRQRVTIRADQESRTGSLVAVMDACNQARIKNYTIATE